eukprot:scaffold21106_cov89-Phaeocystis_antarctica.AAC.1
MHPSVGALALLGELAASVQQRGSAAASEASPALHELADTLAALPASQRQPHVESLVLRAVRELTGDAEASVTASTPLMEAGIDSLAATELSSRLRAATGLVLSPALVFEQPTPRAVAVHVLEKLGEDALTLPSASALDHPTARLPAALSNEREAPVLLGRHPAEASNSAELVLLVLHGEAADGALMYRILELSGWLAELEAHGIKVEFIDAPHV